jgi:toxin ParE1/3/4
MKKYKVFLLPDAIRDLEDIYLDISEQSGFPERARSYIEKLRKECNELEIAPFRGQQRNDLMKNLRIVPIDKKAIIAFMVDEELHAVTILNIFYGGRDYETIMSGFESPSDEPSK